MRNKYGVLRFLLILYAHDWEWDVPDGRQRNTHKNAYLPHPSPLFKTTSELWNAHCQCCSDYYINIYIKWYLEKKIGLSIFGRCFSQGKNPLALKSPLTFLFHLRDLGKLQDPPWPGTDSCSSMPGFPDTFCCGDKSLRLLSRFKLEPACVPKRCQLEIMQKMVFRTLTGIFHCATLLCRQEHYTSFRDSDK